MPTHEQDLPAVSDAGPSNLNVEKHVSEVRHGDSNPVQFSIMSHSCHTVHEVHVAAASDNLLLSVTC